MKVVLSERAYEQIRECVFKANNSYEVGGILLGYRALHCFSVVAVTIPAETSTTSIVSFTLDGDWHTAQAEALIQKYRRKPLILGVWHSHICDIDVFSEQDRRSNRQLAKAFHGIVSMIALLANPMQDLALTAYYISISGKEKKCQVIIDSEKQMEV